MIQRLTNGHGSGLRSGSSEMYCLRGGAMMVLPQGWQGGRFYYSFVMVVNCNGMIVVNACWHDSFSAEHIFGRI